MLTVFEDAFGGKKRRGVSFETYWAALNKRGRYHARHDNAGRADEIADSVTDVLAAVQSVVDGLVSPDGGRYVVSFDAAQSGAGTSLRDRKIVITSGPLFDKTLSLGDIATVLTGFVAHEAGHAEISVATEAMIVRRWRKPSTNAYDRGTAKVPPVVKVLANLLDDVALEKRQMTMYPGIASVFPATLTWVAEKVIRTASKRAVGAYKGMSSLDRINFAIDAVRYARFYKWVGNAPTRRERVWWQDWAAEFSDYENVDVRERGIDVALNHLLDPLNDAPEPEPETEPEPDEGDGDDEGEGEGNGQPGIPDDDADDGKVGIKGQDQGEGSDEGSGDDDDADDGKVGIKGQDQGEGSDEGSGDDDDADGDDADGEPSGGNEGEGSGDSARKADDPEDVTHEEFHDGSKGSGGGGKGDHPVRAEDLGALGDVAERDIRKTLDQVNKPDWSGNRLQTTLNERRERERIRAGGFGTMTVVVSDD